MTHKSPSVCRATAANTYTNTHATQKWGPEFRFLVTSKPMPLPIPHHLRKSTDFESQEQASQQSEEKRTKPSENDLIKAYYFMIKEVRA